MSLTFISPSYHRESYLPTLTHSPTFLLPQACLLGMSRLTSIGGSMKPKPAGSSWERTQGSAIVYRVLSAVHTKIFIIPLNCLVAFKKKSIYFLNTLYFLTASETPRIESLTHQILEPHHSPGLWFLIPRSVDWESAQSLESVQAWLLSSLLWLVCRVHSVPECWSTEIREGRWKENHWSLLRSNFH